MPGPRNNVTTQRALLALAITASLTLSTACTVDASGDNRPATAAEADAFVARVNAHMREHHPENASAQWLASTYIGPDSQRVASKANERALTSYSEWVEEARRFDGLALSPETARAIDLIKLGTAMPPPADPAELSELAAIATRMEGMYGAGTYCEDTDRPETCRDLGELSNTMAESRDHDEQYAAWAGWHTISKPMRDDYVRFVDLVNKGASNLGYANAGEMWRSGYDMSPTDFQDETDRLWGQVQPLYEQLHCYVRGELVDTYGEKGQVDGMIPAHLTGNMWAQQWGNIWDLLQPYEGTASIDVATALRAQREEDLARRLAAIEGEPTATQIVEAGRQADEYIARAMTERAEDFYVSLGMPKLPASFYERSQLIKPRDRDVVCHASAWDLDFAGDVRIKQCIEPTADEFSTIYHELGHIYYYLAYNHLEPLFQSGAHDGFHEAIGDTVVLSLTPGYLNSVGLVDSPEESREALINNQMRMALDKVAFLPFGLLIDRWRWGVFDGSIAPENYNQAWWDLRARYQGVAPVGERGEDLFDPGAKYHVPGNTPYTRYFLAHILQFQFYQSLCETSGHSGPLHECSFYGSEAAGDRFWAMLQQGQGQPWPETLEALTGGREMDASAVLEYFAPLQAWLTERNAGRQCGWDAG
ncbi:M2 family metallopeptidase [Alkalisalibacterium limincola]|uniref:M2 family metallopeptidase n=1 Tax=Alkalisalibacterium limincola TaxID=2699169 RepID=A0A5C8KPN9_9GAMM|nr:M2 family metallopeptidase [Alkalisalibacterium limincola]